MHFIGENWEMIKQTIHTEYDLTNISYNTWIEPLQFYDVKDDTVYIQIPTGQLTGYKGTGPWAYRSACLPKNDRYII